MGMNDDLRRRVVADAMMYVHDHLENVDTPLARSVAALRNAEGGNFDCVSSVAPAFKSSGRMVWPMRGPRVVAACLSEDWADLIFRLLQTHVDNGGAVPDARREPPTPAYIAPEYVHPEPFRVASMEFRGSLLMPGQTNTKFDAPGHFGALQLNTNGPVVGDPMAEYELRLYRRPA